MLKAPQLIAHDPASPTYRKRGRTLTEAEKRRYGFFRPTAEVAAAWRTTLTLARVLRSRLVLFQCSASFTPVAEHARDLTRFFETIERDGLRLVWEPRGDWPDSEVERLCRRLDLIHAVDPFRRASVWASRPTTGCTVAAAPATATRTRTSESSSSGWAGGRPVKERLH